ncbi:MAG TPA: dihydroorotase, partial [bacterium]|nr:dihydroorotase [bacterium]
MNALVIQGGRVVDPATKVDALADLFVADGVIAGVGKRPKGFSTKAETLDARGCLVTPGFVDLHVHLREPGQEGKETIATGTRASLAGGFTTVCCMANTAPVNDNALITRWIAERARETGSPCKVKPIGAVTKNLDGKELAELFGMRQAGAVAFSDDGMPVMSAGLYRRAMELARQIGVPVVSHCEDHTLSAGGAMHEGAVSAAMGLAGVPWTSEAVMVARDVLLAEQTGAQLHLAHLSTEASVRIVRDAKRRGVAVTAEATPHHLTLDHERVRGYDTHAKMNPPLRERRDVDALIAGLADGTIDAIATDHAPHGAGDKDCEFSRAANGITGVETALPVVLSLVRDGRLALPRAVELLTSGPARAFGLTAGTLAVGAAADVTVFDPNEQWRFDAGFSKSTNSPWRGQVLTGRVRHVLVDGARWDGMEAEQ